ncbi:GH39 family glycosyl hydrolase [Parapedobacter sp. 10938]|uniref:GH39 family glycosyl hydrolase n=1 Tax=Parapedobacter flavus TaxID=3110225 RepID=UPI002DB7E549|nr:hypothetical protein [Parapedobacter sp. 10938]MEC3879454.1 hypothetical protein [Parapedobacter sp. 10938]
MTVLRLTLLLVSLFPSLVEARPHPIAKERPASLDSGYHAFHGDIRQSGPEIGNPADNINVWNYAAEWHGGIEKQPADYFHENFPYVRYVQLMTAVGGSEQRDLFKDPLDRSVTDDYDFSPLIRACRNIVGQGLIPHLKLGNVPLKYSADPEISKDFGVNVRPPYDYGLWHGYIKAMMQTLVEEFGEKQVQAWRFGVITEYENKSWFSVDDDPEKTKDAYFKLYDYTVDALEQVLGKNICVGAHSMTVSEGLWDERQLIAHCARGKNNCTGKTGTRLDFLAASYYDERPGKQVVGSASFVETIDHLRATAIKEGFDQVFYGIDEGRILNGLDGKSLFPRAVGQTWQAAYDARMYRMMLDADIDYFSHWAYTSHGILPGVPSVSDQASALFYKMDGSVRLPLEHSAGEKLAGEDVGAVAAWDKHKRKLYLLVYAYSDSLHHTATREISCVISGIKSKSGELSAVRSLISDDSNFFDEWLADRERMGITADDFGWSSDSFVIQPPTLKDGKHVAFFNSRVPFYRSRAQVHPVQEMLEVKDGELHIQTDIPLHGVMLYEITVE